MSPCVSNAATPNCVGSSTCARRICATGGLPVVLAQRLLRVPRRLRTRSTNSTQVLLEHVVAEVHDEVGVAQEVVGDQHAVREPERRVLGDVRDLDAVAGTVADRVPDLRRGRVDADDDADLLDPGPGHVLDAVADDRLVGDRHELLGAGVRDRPQARARTTCEDESLHRSCVYHLVAISGFSLLM